MKYKSPIQRISFVAPISGELSYPSVIKVSHSECDNTDSVKFKVIQTDVKLLT
jgi:hypothetical protein